MHIRSVGFVLLCLVGAPAWSQDAPSAGTIDASVPSLSTDETAVASAEVESPVEDVVVDVKWNAISPIKQVKPVVPPFAKLTRPIRCKLQFTIDETGNPTTINVGECPEAMKANALKAARKWRFEPYRQDGSVVQARFTAVLVIRH